MTATTNTLTAAAGIVAELELGLVDDNVDAHPDKVVLLIDDALLMQIATAQAGLLAMGFGYSEVTIPLNVDVQLFEDGESWIPEERDPSKGDFDVSTSWLMIQANCLSVEIWDEHGGAELHGSCNISDIPGLEAALVNLAPACAQQLISRLK